MAYTKIPSLFYTPSTVTVTIASPAVFTLNGHGLVAGDIVHLTTTGALPTGLAQNTGYYVISAGLTANAFELSTTLGGAAINTSGTQSGTHTLTAECTSQDWNVFLTNNIQALFPLGSYVHMHAVPGSVGLVNNVYLECNGQAVSRTTFSGLFALIGTTYGAGDGSTTFNVPDAQGRFTLGASGTGGHADNNALGDSDGQAVSKRAARHAHNANETAHSHTANIGTSGGENVSHFHNATVPVIDTLVGLAFAAGSRIVGAIVGQTSSSSDTSHTHTITAGVTIVDPGITVGVATAPVDAPSAICSGVLFIKAF